MSREPDRGPGTDRGGHPDTTPVEGRAPSRLLAVGLGIVLALALGEIGVRASGYRRPVLLDAGIRESYRLAPGSRFVYYGYLPGTFVDFANLVELNQFGFHDRDYVLERPAAMTYRVMVLGDSYVAAFEVPIRQTFHKRIEARLGVEDPLGHGSYQVIAFGQGASAQEAELGWLREFGPRYRPDLVLLVFFCGNDVMENSPVLFDRAHDFASRYLREVVPRKVALFETLLVARPSRLNGLLAETVTTLYGQNLHRFHPELSAAELTSPELGVYQRPLTPEWQDAFERTAALLDQIRVETRALGARFALASLSGPQAIGDLGLKRLWTAADPALDYTQPDRWVAEWASRRDVPYVALGPRLAALGRGRVFWHHDAHLNPKGHEVVAGRLYEFLVRLALRPDETHPVGGSLDVFPLEPRAAQSALGTGGVSPPHADRPRSSAR